MTADGDGGDVGNDDSGCVDEDGGDHGCGCGDVGCCGYAFLLHATGKLELDNQINYESCR